MAKNQELPETEPIQSWRPNIEGVPGPIYRAIADAIAQAVRRGELHAGDRLPPQRTLADGLGVDLTTITRAYTEARQRGLVDAIVGRGTFVRAAVQGAAGGTIGRAPMERGGAPAAGIVSRPAAAEASGVDMSMNMPPQPPLLRRLLREGLAARVNEAGLADIMTYRAGLGTGQDRAMAGRWLRPVLGQVDPERILVCAGAQCALTGVLTMLAKPGDLILTEALTYPGFRAVAAQLGLRLAGVTADAEGPLPDALERACRDARPKAFYCVPTIQNPTTVTTSLARRQAVAEIASRYRITVIEDDAYGLLPGTPLPAITSLMPALAGEGGFHVSTVAKCLSPGLRCAYVVAPDRSLAGRLASAIRATSLTPAPLLTGLVTRWIGDGSALLLRDAVRDEARARQSIAREMLPAESVAAHPDGLHLWLTLPAHWNRRAFSAESRRQGLTLVPSDAFLVEGEAPNAVRMSLGVAESREALRAALRSVAVTMLADAPRSYAEIV